jgi:hypothetical protein
MLGTSVHMAHKVWGGIRQANFIEFYMKDDKDLGKTS